MTSTCCGASSCARRTRTAPSTCPTRAARSSSARPSRSDRPLRLGVDEASALLVALRMLAEVGQVAPAPGRPRGRRSAAPSPSSRRRRGRQRRPARRWRCRWTGTPNAASRPSCMRRSRRARRIHLSYYVPGRDEATERDVDPMRLLVVEGRTYLEGWCRRAEGVRLFRLDRVLASRCSRWRPRCRGRRSPWTSTAACSGPRRTDLRVVIELSPYGRWVAEYYPCEEVTELGEGRLRVILRTPDTRMGAPARPAARRGRPRRRAC